MDPNQQNCFGHTPLHVIIKKTDHVGAVNLLIQHHADPHIPNGLNQTALDFVVMNERIEMRFFLNHGADPYQFMEDAILWEKSKIFPYIIESIGIDINRVNANGFTALGLAEYVQTKSNSPEIKEIIRLLNYRNAENKTPSRKQLKGIKNGLDKRIIVGNLKVAKKLLKKKKG